MRSYVSNNGLDHNHKSFMMGPPLGRDRLCLFLLGNCIIIASAVLKEDIRSILQNNSALCTLQSRLRPICFFENLFSWLHKKDLVLNPVRVTQFSSYLFVRSTTHKKNDVQVNLLRNINTTIFYDSFGIRRKEGMNE